MSALASYLRDLGFETPLKGGGGKSTGKSQSDDAFVQGEAHAFYTLVSLIQQQADAFELSFRHLAFDGFNAERDLL